MLRINDLNYFLLWIIPGIVGGGVKIATIKCLLLFLSRVTSESGPV